MAHLTTVADAAAAYLADVEDLAQRLLAQWEDAGDRRATIADARRVATECYPLSP